MSVLRNFDKRCCQTSRKRQKPPELTFCNVVLKVAKTAWILRQLAGEFACGFQTGSVWHGLDWTADCSQVLKRFEIFSVAFLAIAVCVAEKNEHWPHLRLPLRAEACVFSNASGKQPPSLAGGLAGSVFGLISSGVPVYPFNTFMLVLGFGERCSTSCGAPS